MNGHFIFGATAKYMWKSIFIVKTRREAFSPLVATPNRVHSFHALPIFSRYKLYSYAAKAAFRLGGIANGLLSYALGKVLK
jgi:hypothetical protein